VRNASTGEPIGSVPEAAEADVDAAVAAARRAFDDPSGWSTWPTAERAAALERLAAELETRAQEIGRLVSMQNGMPIALSPIIEGMTPVGTLRYMASLLATSPVEEETSRFLGGDLVIRHEPIGVIAGIGPRNYPQTLSSFKYAPALAAGNTIVLKPSPETVLDSYVFAEAVIAASIPPGVINIVPGGRETGAYLVQHRDVDKVAYTGSTAAGRQIAEVCGSLLRPVSLELGGKSAAIILDDADLDLAKIGQKRRPAGNRRRAAGRPGPGLVRRADDLRGRGQQAGDRAGGDLRPGTVDHRVHRRGRRRQARERVGLRPRRLGLDGRSGAGAARRAPSTHRHDGHQRLPARPGGAVGRRQVERPRPRARSRRDRRLPEPQDRPRLIRQPPPLNTARQRDYVAEEQFGPAPPYRAA
jgi:hypothetical protein